MTTPDLSFIIPSKAKAWVGLVGTGLSFVVPLILEVTDGLPSPWPAVIGAVLWILTALGIYRVPYAPKGTVLVPEETVAPPLRTVESTGGGSITVVRGDSGGGGGSYQNPWR